MSPDSSARSAGSTSEIESAVCPGVVTTRSCRPSTSTSSSSTSGSPSKQYAGSRARTGQPLRVGELDGDLGVVEVVVREQHQRDVAGLLVELVEVAVLDRAGVHHDRPRRRPAR